MAKCKIIKELAERVDSKTRYNVNSKHAGPAMTNKTTERYGKNANRAQIERSFKRLSRRNTGHLEGDFFSCVKPRSRL
jgi:hypothetical protein